MRYRKHILASILGLLSTLNLIAQQAVSQKEIIGIENTSLAQDFNLREKNGVYPVKIEERKFSSFLGGILYTELQFNTKKLISTNIEEMRGKYEKFVYTYNGSQLTKLQVYNKSGSLRAFYPETFYEYNAQGNLVKTKSTPQFLRAPKVNTYTYDMANGKVTMTSTAGNKSEYVLDKSFKVVSKFNYDQNGLTYKYFYSYDDANRVLKIKKENLSRTATQFLSEENFTFNNKGYVTRYNGIAKVVLAFDYIYDEFGNWIAKYSLTDTKPTENVVTRFITYSNGKTTGYKTNTDSNLKADLNKNINIPNGISVMLISNSNSYKIYKNGKNITKNKSAYKQHSVGGDMYFQDIKEKKYYRMTNVDLKENYIYIPLEGYDAPLGFWSRTNNNKFVAYDENGNNILDDLKKHGYDITNKHYILETNSGRQSVLRNMKTTPLYTPKPIELYIADKPNASSSNNSINNSVASKSKSSTKYLEAAECMDAKCLRDNFAIKTLRCDMESKCDAEEWSAILNTHITNLERLNVSQTEFEKDFQSRISTVKLYNFWGIHEFLNSNAKQKYKDLTLSYFDDNKKTLLNQMTLYKEDGNLEINLPMQQVSVYSYDTFDNALQVYRLDQKQNEAIKNFEKQSGIKQTIKPSNINLDMVLPKLIAPENRTAFWEKTNDGFKVSLTFGAGKIGDTEVVNPVKLGSHIVCTDKALGSVYILRNYDNAKPNVKYEVSVYKYSEGNDIVLWLKQGANTKMYKSGQVYDVVAKNSYESPVDRLVNLQSENYILGNYTNTADDKVSYASKILPRALTLSKYGEAPSSGVYWRHYDNFYYMVKDGEYIDFDVKHTFKGKDALIYHLGSKATYILKDYQKLDDGLWRKAIAVKPNHAVWIKYDNGRFNCYEKATKNITKNKWSTDNSSDLWIMDYNDEPKYILKNFKNVATNSFYVAENYISKETTAKGYSTSNTSVSSTTNSNKKSNNSPTVNLSSSDIASKVKAYYNTNNGDARAMAKAINADYRQLMQTLSGDALYTEGAKYFVALNDIHPSLPFSIFMKWEDTNSITPIKDKLPKEIQDNITKAAQGTINSYNKYINSKEVKDAIKKNGGGYYKPKN